MTRVTHWQARAVPMPIPGAASVPRVVVASLYLETTRIALAQELEAEAETRLMMAATALGKGQRDRVAEHIAENRSFESAARAVEYGATAVELGETRYELVSVTEEMSTPTGDTP